VIDHPASTVGELAAALGLQQPNVSSGLRELERRGLVTREKSERDRRISLLQPTASGIAEHQAIAEEWAGPVNAALEELTPQQQAALAAAADALAAAHQALRRGMNATPRP